MIVSTTTVRVRYAEVDRLAAVNSARYFEWFELARSDLLRAAGIPYGSLEERGFMLPVVEANCRYVAKLGYDEIVRIEASLDVLSPVRLRFSFEVLRVEDAGAAVAASGFTEHAVINRSGALTRLPADVLAVLSGG